jgi:Carboxypeptidase regulatory-like domain
LGIGGIEKFMKKTIIGASLLVMLSPLMLSLLMLSASVFSRSALAAPAQLFGRDSKQDKTRLLTGKVLDGGDNPLPNAVVYLTNTHTRSVKTYIVGPDGGYRFPALQPSVDYEVYAQYDNRKSGTKTVSQFDDRSQVYISLKVATK